MRRLTLALIGMFVTVLPTYAQDYPWQNFAAQDAMNTLHNQLLRQTIEGAQSQGNSASTLATSETVTTLFHIAPSQRQGAAAIPRFY